MILVIIAFGIVATLYMINKDKIVDVYDEAWVWAKDAGPKTRPPPPMSDEQKEIVAKMKALNKQQQESGYVSKAQAIDFSAGLTYEQMGISPGSKLEQ